MIESRASAARPARPGRGGEPRGRRDGAALRRAAPAGRRRAGLALRLGLLVLAAASARPVRPAPAPARPSPHSSRASSARMRDGGAVSRRRADGNHDLRRGHVRAPLRPGRAGRNGRRGRRGGHAPRLPLGDVGDASPPASIVRFGFRRTARWGAILIFAGLVWPGRRRLPERLGALDLGGLRARRRGPRPFVHVAGPRRSRTSWTSGSAAWRRASSRSSERSAARSASARSAACSPWASTGGSAPRPRPRDACSRRAENGGAGAVASGDVSDGDRAFAHPGVRDPRGPGDRQFSRGEPVSRSARSPRAAVGGPAGRSPFLRLSSA